MNRSNSSYWEGKLVSFCLLLAAVSCRPTDDPNDLPVARVYDEQLKRSELQAMMPDRLQEGDSALLADQLINKWIAEKAVLALAEKNLREEQKDFTQKLEEYRHSLLIYAYERELVNQKLDTLVSEAEIESFFNQNIESFKLKNYILKAWFIEVSSDAPRRKQLISWFRSDKEKDWEKLDEYCNKFAEFCFFKEDQWIYVDDLLKQVPLNPDGWDNFLRNTTYHEFEKDGKLYLLRVFDYLLRGETAPLELEREKVKNLIINKRKVDLVKKMRNDAVTEAYAKNEIEWVKD